MVTTDLITEYLDEVQDSARKGDKATDTLAVLDIVERYKNRTEGDAASQMFFNGEHAFHRGQYKIALKNYLAAKEVPHCQFCCLRASAYALKQQGKNEKAAGYAKKALALRSDDPFTLELLGKVLPGIAPGQSEEQVDKAIDALSSQKENTDGPVPLANEEINALSDIFSDHDTDEQTEDDSLDPNQPYSDETDADAPPTYELTSHPLERLMSRRMEPPMDTDTQVISPEANKEASAAGSAVDELNKLADSKYAVEEKSTEEYLSKMGVGLVDKDGIQETIETFQERRRDLITDYTKAAHAKAKKGDNALHVLTGWNDRDGNTENIGEKLLSASCRKAEGGFYVRWNGKGVAINPGPNFLRNLHGAGLHISDIDCVVVTRANSDAHADIESIYQLNYQLNLTAPSEDLHIIHYYLNQRAHRDLTSKLKPNFKQERNTVHSLELYVDSPDVEKVELTSHLTLHYFPTTSHEAESPSQAKQSSEPSSSCLGIRLECKPADSTSCSATLGLVSGTPWSPMLAHNLGRCDVLIAGFQHTSSKDYRKVKYNDDSLGYFGCYSLMEEVAPRVMLCCEFEGREGDVRLESTRKMRQEYAYSNQNATSILPGDNSLYLDLKTMQVKCSVSKQLTDPAKVRVVKNAEAFGRLQYLSPSCFV